MYPSLKIKPAILDSIEAAVMANNLDKVKALLIRIKAAYNNTTVQMCLDSMSRQAILHDHETILQYFLNEEAFNPRGYLFDEDGKVTQMPLMVFAAEAGSLKIFQLLFEKLKVTCDSYCTDRNDIPLVILSVIGNNKIDFLTYLLDKKISLEPQSIKLEWATFLGTAAMNDNRGMVNLLIDYGADFSHALRAMYNVYKDKQKKISSAATRIHPDSDEFNELQQEQVMLKNQYRQALTLLFDHSAGIDIKAGRFTSTLECFDNDASNLCLAACSYQGVPFTIELVSKHNILNVTKAFISLNDLEKIADAERRELVTRNVNEKIAARGNSSSSDDYINVVALPDAVMAKDHAAVAMRIEHDADPNVEIGIGCNLSPLIVYAANDRTLLIVQSLLKKARQIPQNNLMDALHIAHQNHDNDLIELLDPICDAKAKDTHGYTKAHFAAQAGNLEALYSSERKGADLNAIAKIEDVHPFSGKSYVWEISPLSLAIKHCGKIDATQNPALYSDYLKTITYLLKEPKVNFALALTEAIKIENIELIDLIIQNMYKYCDNQDAFFLSQWYVPYQIQALKAEKKWKEILLLFRKHYTPFDKHDKDSGLSLLEVAILFLPSNRGLNQLRDEASIVARGHPSASSYLHKLDEQVLSEYSNAMERVNFILEPILVMSKYSVFIMPNNQGENILHFILRHRSHLLTLIPESIQLFDKLLLIHPDMLKQLDNLGNTPLHIATGKGDLAAVKFLLQNKANVNCKNNKGKTPLHYAAASADLEILEILLNAGAQVNVKDNCNRTPADVCLTAFEYKYNRYVFDTEESLERNKAPYCSVLERLHTLTVSNKEITRNLTMSNFLQKSSRLFQESVTTHRSGLNEPLDSQPQVKVRF